MKSVWTDIHIKEREKLCGTVNADCTVIGAGMAGLMIAYELQKRGFDVVVIDRGRICSGATENTTAKITAQHGLIYDKLARHIGYDTAKLYYESNRDAVDKYERMTLELDIDCDFERKPSYIYSVKGAYDIITEAHAVYRLGIKSAYTRDTSLPYGVKSALRLDDQAQFHPLKFAKALAQELKIYEMTPALDIDGEYIKTEFGEIRSRYIVNATHYPIINLPGLYFMRQHQERSYAVAISTSRGLDGMYYGIDDNRSLRSFKGGIIIGGEKHRTGTNKKGGCLMRLVDFSKRYYPDSEVITTWSNQDAITHDSMPFIGQFSVFSPNMYIATGFNKWGMSLSAVASEVIPDLICGRENDYADIYSPRRMNLRASAKRLVTDVGYSVKGLCSAVVTQKEQRCTHLGCRLKRNPDTGELECSCHGSEFHQDGSVVFSPATNSIDRSGFR